MAQTMMMTAPPSHPNGSQINGEKISTENHTPTLFFQGQDVKRSGTPETIMTEIPNKPDITMPCPKCNIFIDLRDLLSHRIYHNALVTLKYRGNSKPENSEALLRRRNLLLKKLMESTSAENPLNLQQVQKINAAYELLKADTEDTYEGTRQVRDNVKTEVQGLALNCSPKCAFAVGICSNSNERWKSCMEDTRVFQDCLGDDKHKCYLAVFDGYHGRFAAEVSASEMHKLLLHEMAKFDPRTKSTQAVNMAESTDISHYEFSRPQTKESERVLLYEESTNIVQQIITFCEGKYDSLMQGRIRSSGSIRISEPEKEAKKKKIKSPFAEKLSNAFKKIYQLIDILLSYGKDELSRVRWSGCSSACVLIQDSKKEPEVDESLGENNGDYNRLPEEIGQIHLANAGNVHVVLVRGNKAYRISKEHSAQNIKERERVLKAGGTFSESTKECLVNSVISTTRGLGNHGDPKLKKCVLAEPYCTTVPIDQYAQFLILASHGVWEVFSEDEAASLLLSMLPSNQLPPPDRTNSGITQLLNEYDNEISEGVFGKQRSSFSGSNTTRIRLQEPSSAEQRSGLNTVHEDAADLTNTTEADSLNFLSNPKSSLMMKQDSKTSSLLQHQHSQRSTLDADLQTEVGSTFDGYDEDSGNDADIDTFRDGLSLQDDSRLSFGTPGIHSREDLQRHFAKQMAEYLVQAALLAGSKDNITVQIRCTEGQTALLGEFRGSVHSPSGSLKPPGFIQGLCEHLSSGLQTVRNEEVQKSSRVLIIMDRVMK